MTITLYNSLSKKVEAFIPLNNENIKLYSCGPTVYDYISIGNFRTFALTDFVVRALRYHGYKVKYIMNLTDVGHLVSDADTGQDKLEKSAENQGKSAREIADFYIKSFLTDYEKLNLTAPLKFTRATEYINSQIELIETLERKGFTYKTSDGVYFDTSKFAEYGKLSGLDPNKIIEGARVEPNIEKRNNNDFALWKFSPKDKNRWQEWNSPWGIGFPGWHIECSAMVLDELGDTIDIHIGGEDLKMTHHQNEIAQSECATGNKFSKYWIHGAFLQVDGGKMGKSLGNAFTIADIESKGFLPLSLRYMYMTAHYRSPLNFTWSNLTAAETALKRLYSAIEGYKYDSNASVDMQFKEKFLTALSEDFNMPKALSVLWDLVKSDLSEGVKVATILDFDSVFGFNVENYLEIDIPEEIVNLAKTREEYRKAGIYDKADLIRGQIKKKGYLVLDEDSGYKLKKIL